VINSRNSIGPLFDDPPFFDNKKNKIDFNGKKKGSSKKGFFSATTGIIESASVQRYGGKKRPRGGLKPTF